MGLVLTRKPGQSLYIGDDIKITLHGIRGNQVRLGIDAPSSVKIFREEIYQEIIKENQLAAAELPPDLADVAKTWANKKQAALDSFSLRRKKTVEEDEG